jgi:hypothetical protein
MSQITKESSVSLEHLDDHLKAILKLKIREFVHLSPWFRNIPSIDTQSYPRAIAAPRRNPVINAETDCPNRGQSGTRRRRVRPVVV